jgi:hypothetical protein
VWYLEHEGNAAEPEVVSVCRAYYPDDAYVTVVVGPSAEAEVTVEVPVGLTCPPSFDEDEWANLDSQPLGFGVEHLDASHVVVTRTHTGAGWSIWTRRSWL